MTQSLFVRAGVAGLTAMLLTTTLCAAGISLVNAAPAAADDGQLTSSAVTVTNKDYALNPDDAPFPDLEVTVSQTKDLVSQGIKVSWTGGEKSERPQGSTGGSNFLQIFQCWGEDPDNPGHPDRRTCQYGGTRGYASMRDGFTELENVAPEDEKYTGDLGWYAYTGIPFVATNSAHIVDENSAPEDRVLSNFTNVDGTPVKKPDAEMADLNTNQFFTSYTTNEVKWAGTGADGAGSAPFEVQTAMQSTALGCGAPVQATDGTVSGESCWLVILPRGTGDSGASDISRSGLWWDAWEHHLAVKLDFKPLGVRCAIGDAERQLAGSELIAGAMASWQPELCLGDNGSPFVLSQGNEADALVKAAGSDASPLAFTSRPLDMSRVGDASDPLAYAPVALAGIAVSFSIDRQPNPQEATEEERARAALPMLDLKLTPRLLAKLLTSSYVDALPDGADKSHVGYINFRDQGHNARTIVQDPDFLAINDPEWAHQIVVGASIADALTPSGRSDIATRLWEYVVSDDKARAWLDGEPDEWGMIVNPWYSTNPEVNPTGVGMTYPIDNFPRADPAEKPDTTQSDPANGTGPINLVTWRPYTQSFADSAYHVLRGDGMILGAWDKFSIPPKFGSAERELLGSQKVLGVTSTPAAELYQTVTAAIRNPAGAFVLPSRESIGAAGAVMTPTKSQPRVSEYDFASTTVKAATTSYPLAMPVYAALNPQQTDQDLRAVYASLIRYAAEDGQDPGTDAGELPPGYAPLPASWVAQAKDAAAAIERGSLAVPQPSATGGGTSSTATGSSGPGTPASSAPAVSTATGTSGTVTTPVVTGQAAGQLAGAPTAADPDAGAFAAALPLGLVAGLVSGVAAIAMTKLRRRA